MSTVASLRTPEARLLPPLRLTTEEVCRRTGASQRTVLRWCASGKLRHFKVGRFLRIDSDALVEFLERYTRSDGA